MSEMRHTHPADHCRGPEQLLLPAVPTSAARKFRRRATEAVAETKIQVGSKSESQGDGAEAMSVD